MTIPTNLLSARFDINNFTAMRLEIVIISEGVMDLDEQYLWHDTEMHSDRDVLENPSVKDGPVELMR